MAVRRAGASRERGREEEKPSPAAAILASGRASRGWLRQRQSGGCAALRLLAAARWVAARVAQGATRGLGSERP